MSMNTLQDLTTHTTVARVNLLPPGLDDARKLRQLQMGLGAGVLVTVALVGLGYVIGAGHVSTAQDALASEQARTVQLQTEQRQYAEVPKVEAQVVAAEKAQAAVNAPNVSWAGMLDAIATSGPANNSFQSLALALDPAATGATGVGTTAPTDPLGVPGIGTLTITGATRSQNDVASVLEGLTRVQGLAHPLLSTSTFAPDTGVVDYTTTATITPDALLNKQ
ncbi:hypothetical protein [Kineococcus sp. NPDC059986]|uniref:PilN domain-containing protein n=1 Tax=Kineococcus sp. NPDC059986 TaxID=3155538 RepID=UPI00344EF040